MNLMMVGGEVVNLDHLWRARYSEGGGRPCLVLSAIDEREEVKVRDGEARAAWRVIRRLCRFGEADAPAGGPVYRILDPAGRRSGPEGDALAAARDLGALSVAAEQLSRREDAPEAIYPIAAGLEPWGELRVVGPGRWHLRSDDGTVTILPGAIIL